MIRKKESKAAPKLSWLILETASELVCYGWFQLKVKSEIVWSKLNFIKITWMASSLGSGKETWSLFQLKITQGIYVYAVANGF